MDGSLSSALWDSDVGPGESSVIWISPRDLLFLDDKGGLELAIDHLLESHEDAQQSKGNEHVRAIVQSIHLILYILLGLDNLLVQGEWSKDNSLVGWLGLGRYINWLVNNLRSCLRQDLGLDHWQDLRLDKFYWFRLRVVQDRILELHIHFKIN